MPARFRHGDRLIDNPGNTLIVGIIIVLGIAFLLSAASGVGKGIQWISNTNMVLAAIIALFVLVVGPTVVIMNMVPTTLGNYLQDFFAMASRTAQSSEDAGDWLSAWTIFYWAWWVSWSPFVGMFLARISRGRTVREFIMVILLVPTSVTILWFSIFCGTAINLEETGKSIWGDGDATKMLFNLLHEYPFGAGVSIIAMLLLATFFITSADSASTVMGSMSQRGRLVASPIVTVLWGVLTCAIAGSCRSVMDWITRITIIAASHCAHHRSDAWEGPGDDPSARTRTSGDAAARGPQYGNAKIADVARSVEEPPQRRHDGSLGHPRCRHRRGRRGRGPPMRKAPSGPRRSETMSVYDGEGGLRSAEDADYINNRNDEDADGRS